MKDDMFTWIEAGIRTRRHFAKLTNLKAEPFLNLTKHPHQSNDGAHWSTQKLKDLRNEYLLACKRLDPQLSLGLDA